MKTLWLFLRALACLLACGVSAFAQVPVALAPVAHLQFLSATGVPLANGKVFTYDAGTVNLRNTYKDSFGIIQNTDPIILDQGGYADIWLANQAYKFVVQNSLGAQQWSVDNIQTYFGLLNSANIWTLGQTFTQPITITPADNQIILGAAGNQMTLDAPPPTGNQILHFPVITDTLVGRTTTDTLTNKTLTSPAINTPLINGCGMSNGPATYICVANANPTGTTLSTLTKFFNAPAQVIIGATTDTSGIIGICVSACGTAGTAVIQQSGDVSCVFDGATTAEHFVTASATVGGDCHDAGATAVAGVQSLGQVKSSNVGAGTYVMNLNSSGVVSPFLTGLTLANEGVTGTLANGLAKQTGAPSKAIKTSITDTTGAIGIVTSGAGIVGSATIQQQGPVNCAFDGATTANDYVIMSVTTAGNCHDSGIVPPALPPNGQQVLGQVLSTNVAGGTFLMNFYAPGLIPPVVGFPPQRVVLGGPVAIAATTQTTILTKSVTFPSVPGTYRASLSFNVWVTAGSNHCAAEVQDHTNNLAFASTGQNANGVGYMGLAGAEITSQTYAASAVVSFTVEVECNNGAGGLIGATVNMNGGALFTMAPAEPSYLSITPVWSN